VGEVDQQSLHLNDAQIEQYGKTSDTTGPEAGQQIETHLADCPACRDRVLVSQRARFALMGDAPVKTAPLPDRPGPQCPSEDDLRNLAAGLCPPDQATKFTEHAAQCNHCGPLLRMYAEDFSDDLGKDNEAVVRKLKSSSRGWQKKLVSRVLAGSSAVPAQSPKRSFFSVWVLVPTAVVACAAIVFAVWYSQRETPGKVEKLLAQAYTEQRTMELRWPGAEWAPPSIYRGKEASSKPLPLLEAEEILGRRQEGFAADVAWVQAAEEKEILDGNPQTAVVILTRAVQTHPDSVPLLLDLATAHFRLGERSQDQQEYEKARETLSEALVQEPSNVVALFNRAITYQRLRKMDEAAKDWAAFLKYERNQRWSDEGRKRLGDLRPVR